MQDETLDPLPFGTRVEIGGRTMLRPGFSLVGLTGMVYLPAPGVPPGCTTIIVDWKAHGYTPENGYAEDSLPPMINVPTQHLDVFKGEVEEPEVKAKPKFVPRKDRIDPRTGKQVEESGEAEESAEPKKGEKGDDDEPPRPKLRLV